jgi:hypothetical protein
MPSEKEIITGPPIDVSGEIARHDVVKLVVNTFIETEYEKKGKGIGFRYPVENVGERNGIFIARPGHKKNFDFKVEVAKAHKVGEGSHEEVIEEVRKLRYQTPKVFKAFWTALTAVYKGEEANVEAAVKLIAVSIPKKYIEIIKILKWMFIMEDILYWDNEGRAFLYNALQYCTSINKSDTVEEFTQPDRLRSKLKKLGKEWITP